MSMLSKRIKVYRSLQQYQIATPILGILTKGRKFEDVFSRLLTTKPKMGDYATVTYVTSNEGEVATELARRIVEKNLAACVNIVSSVNSIYKWKGKIEQDNEALLIIKSLSSKTEALTQFVEKNHMYTTPEVVTVKVDSGSAKYLEWLKNCVNGSNRSSKSSKSSDD